MLETKTKIRIATLMSQMLCMLRARAGRPPTVDAVQRNGFNWSLDLREGIDLGIYLGVYERETTAAIRRLVKPGWVALDVGANIGAHTLEIARQAGPTGRVIAFEPTAYAISRLRRHLALNERVARRVVVEQAMLTAAGVTTPEVAIYSRWPLYAADGLHDKHLGKLESTDGARAVALDDYLAEKDIRKVDFMKLDVDGFECDVLDGARSCLATMKPLIVIELAPYSLLERGRTLADLMRPLQTAGYRLYHLSGTPLPGRPEILEPQIEKRGGFNVVARVD